MHKNSTGDSWDNAGGLGATEMELETVVTSKQNEKEGFGNFLKEPRPDL